MAPHTTIGRPPIPVGQEGEDLPETLDAKLVNALVGRMNVITRRRGEEPVAWARAFRAREHRRHRTRRRWRSAWWT